MAWTMKHRKVPSFLRDGATAFRWALRHVGDLESYVEEMNEQHRGLGDEFYGERAEIYSDFARDVYRDGAVTIYRAVRVPLDSEGNPVVHFDDLGKAWSKDPRGAGVFGVVPHSSVETRDVVMTGLVKASDVDWEYGFTSFMYYGEDQWEVSLLPNVPVLVTHLDGVPITPPIEGNSGLVREIWSDPEAVEPMVL